MAFEWFQNGYPLNGPDGDSSGTKAASGAGGLGVREKSRRRGVPTFAFEVSHKVRVLAGERTKNRTNTSV